MNLIKFLGEVNYKDKKVMRLSEDMGGLTIIGYWVRTDLLTDYENFYEEEYKND